MRRFFICFLLCLMPLRMWASAWMPMTESMAFSSAAQASMNHEGMNHEAMHLANLNCHETAKASAPQQEGAIDHAAHSGQDLVVDVAMQKDACHDGHCQFCGVCHQSASPVDLKFVALEVQGYPLPLSVLSLEAGVASPPLIKPPIS